MADRRDEDIESSDGRLDKWLWHARLLKSRTLATRLVAEGKVRVNREKVTKPAYSIRPGDVVTAAIHTHIRVLKVLNLGVRRGPASEAQTLYEDLSPPIPPGRAAPADPSTPAPIALRERGAGRPVKRERRALEALRRKNDSDIGG
jgi:ribosome-associated heat shock protein Hsp15